MNLEISAVHFFYFFVMVRLTHVVLACQKYCLTRYKFVCFSQWMVGFFIWLYFDISKFSEYFFHNCVICLKNKTKKQTNIIVVLLDLTMCLVGLQEVEVTLLLRRRTHQGHSTSMAITSAFLQKLSLPLFYSHMAGLTVARCCHAAGWIHVLEENKIASEPTATPQKEGTHLRLLRWFN